MPCVLIVAAGLVFKGTPTSSTSIGAPLLGIFPFVVMFLVTSVATLRERTSGTLERLLTMPIGKLDFLLGYALAFGWPGHRPGLRRQRSRAVGPRPRRRRTDLAAGAVAVLDAMLGMALGLFVSAFAAHRVPGRPVPAGRSCFPQFLLCGLLVPRDADDRLPARALQRSAAVLRGRRHARGDDVGHGAAATRGATSASSWVRSCSPWRSAPPPCAAAPSEVAMRAATLRRRTEWLAGRHARRTSDGLCGAATLRRRTE